MHWPPRVPGQQETHGVIQTVSTMESLRIKLHTAILFPCIEHRYCMHYDIDIVDIHRCMRVHLCMRHS